MMPQTTHYIKDESAMVAFGGQLAKEFQEGGIILLNGDLGAGKTTLVRGVLRHLGHNGNVKSPTYTLVEPYLLNDKVIYHFDLYRLGDPEELEYVGGRDYWESGALCLIEWPHKAKGFLPKADLIVDIAYQDSGRNISLKHPK